MTNLDTIKAEAARRFESQFCNNHQKPIRFLRSVFYDEQDGAEQIEKFILSEIDRAVEAVVGEIKNWMKKDENWGWDDDRDFKYVKEDDILQKLSTLAKDSKENEVEGGDSFNDHMETEDKY